MTRSSELPSGDAEDRSTGAVTAGGGSAAAGSCAGAPRASGTPAPGVPLTAAQRRLWALAQLRPDDSFYSIPFAVDIDGPLDEGALRRALTELVARHDSLRVRFRSGPTGPVQVVEPPRPVDLAVDDLTGLASTDRVDRAAALGAAFAAEPLMVDGGDLLRVRLLRLDGQRYRLLVGVHHIVFDGESLEIFVRDLLALYEADATGAALPPPPGPAGDGPGYLARRAARDAAELAERLDYWTRRLRGTPALIELPTRAARPARPDYRAARRSRLMPASLLDPLRSLARQRRCTTYLILKAAVDVVLHSYGNTDVLTGMALSGRDDPGSDGVIGFLARPITLRSTITGDQTFGEVLAEVRADVLDAHEYPDLPFEAVLDALGVERDPSHSPLYQVSFDHTVHRPPRLAAGTAFTVGELPLTSLKVDLSVGVAERPEGLLGEIDYRVDLFDPADIDRMLARLEAVLDRVARDPDVRVHDLVCTGAERDLLLGAWSRADGPASGDGEASGRASNDREAVAAGLVYESISSRMRTAPEAPAVGYGDHYLTYQELGEAAGRWAGRLRDLGVRAQDPVAVCLPPSVALPAVVLGVLAAGAVCVPLDPALPAYRFSTAIDDTGATVVLADASSAAFFDRTRCRVVELAAAELSGEDAVAGTDAGTGGLPPDGPVAAGPATGPRSAACVLYTSGWCGESKPVVIEHAGLAHAVACAGRAVPAGTFAELTLGVPPTSVFGLVSLLATLAAGGRVTVATGTAAARDATAWPLAVPGSGGYARYGAVETTGVVLAGTCADDGIGLLGRPVGGTRAYVLDERLRPVAAGAVGELYLAGASLARGYLDEPGLTAGRYLPDPFAGDGERMYATGDLVRFDPTGRLHFVARAGHRPVVRGRPVTPAHIEAVAATHPDVLRAFAFTAPDRDREPHLAVVVKDPDTFPVDELRARLADRLPGYLLPTAVAAVGYLPVLASGMPDPRAAARAVTRSAARERERRQAERARVDAAQAAGGGASSVDAAGAVAAAWERVLGHAVAPDVNFFEAGGNSLLLLRLREELRAAFSVEITIVELFRHSTVLAMAAFLAAAQGASDAGTRPAAPAGADERGQARLAARRSRGTRRGEP